MNKLKLGSLVYGISLTVILSSQVQAAILTTPIDALVVAGGNLTLDSSEVHGSIHSNGEIIFSGSSTIFGDVSGNGDISNSGGLTTIIGDVSLPASGTLGGGISYTGALITEDSSIPIPTLMDIRETLIANSIAFTDITGDISFDHLTTGIFVVSGEATFLSDLSGNTATIIAHSIAEGQEPAFDAALTSLPSIFPFGLALYSELELVGPTAHMTGAIISASDVSISNLILTPAVVPVPAAVWLFGTALIGLVGFSKRKNRIAA